MDAFASGKTDRIYFLDRFTGEIFFVPAAMEDEDFWRQVENNNERFLQIPNLDMGSEKRILLDFMSTVENAELEQMLQHAMSGKKPYCKTSDVLAFFPDEHERLMEMKDDFVTVKVKNWLEANEIFTMETSAMLQSSPV